MHTKKTLYTSWGEVLSGFRKGDLQNTNCTFLNPEEGKIELVSI